MIKPEPILAVADVEKSSLWYQDLLHCKGAHGGNTFEILIDENNEQILSLHKWEVHGHPTLSDPTKATGNGLILYFVVEDLGLIWENATKLGATVEEEPHLNTNSGRMEFSIRDLDNYYISITTDNAN